MESHYPYTAERHFKREHLKEGLHIYPLPIDDEISRLIGLIVACWGDFENSLNKLIASLLPTAELGEVDWERKGFKKRKVLLKDALKAIEFEQNNDEANRRLATLLGHATILHRQRNLVAHGSYIFTIAPYSNRCSITSHAFYNGKEESLLLDPTMLEKLWHDIAHLTGELITIFKIVGDYDGISPLPDKQILQLFDRMDRQNDPSRRG